MTATHHADYPVLEGWMTLAEAAHRLGCTRQNIHLLAAAGKLTTVHRIGRALIVRESDVDELLVEREVTT
jgi:excisionase family DNA binding protein